MYDVAIIGGGINGCGIARDAAGRGFSVFLAEKGDLAHGTSSGSTKLIHGGLRYLEQYEFRLVRESLKEREKLWKMAPHIIWPLRFVLPYGDEGDEEGVESSTAERFSGATQRPAWLLRFGLFIYDHLGGRDLLPPTRTLDMNSDAAAAPLKSNYRYAFEYSDCWVDDARLVVLNARDAADRGATIKTNTTVVNAIREADHWIVETENGLTGEIESLRARFLVNAAGPWVDRVLAGSLGRNNVKNVRLVQGSHIVVPKLFNHNRCYIFQNNDGRIFFAIPYEHEFTLIGTTDLDFSGDPESAGITDAEIDYLCRAASIYFKMSVVPEQIVWKYSAVRPLFDDGASKAQEATRDYILKSEGEVKEAKLLNIFGGKITTYRKLAETVVAEIEQQLGENGTAWTGNSHLPGGNFAVDGFENQVDQLAEAYPFLDNRASRRLVRNYGTLSTEVLGDAICAEDLGMNFGSGLTEREVDYLRRFEWAVTADDILWRRTKLGLHLEQAAIDRLKSWLEKHPVNSRNGVSAQHEANWSRSTEETI